jgi:hypothetical protein
MYSPIFASNCGSCAGAGTGDGWLDVSEGSVANELQIVRIVRTRRTVGRRCVGRALFITDLRVFRSLLSE